MEAPARTSKDTQEVVPAPAEAASPAAHVPGQRQSWVFDGDFYRSVLPQLIAGQGRKRGSDVPVVELRLADGIALDLCKILRLAERWMCVSYYRDSSCHDEDIAFVPYGAVARVQVSMHAPDRRRLGFRVDEE
jgi:hypothetical protein